MGHSRDSSQGGDRSPTSGQHPHGSLPLPPWLESHRQPRGTASRSSPISAGDIQSPQLNAKFTFFKKNAIILNHSQLSHSSSYPQTSSRCPKLWAGDGRGQQGTGTIPLCIAAHPAPLRSLPIQKVVPRFAKALWLITQLLPDCSCILGRQRL